MMLGMTTERTAMAKWYWVAVICGGLGIFEATQTVVVMRAEGMHHAWTKLFITILLSWVPWAVAAQAVMRLGRDYPVFHRGWASAWMRHGVMWMAILISATTWNTVIEGRLNPWTPESTTSTLLELWRLKFTNEVLGSLILYAGILLVGWILDSRERLARQRMEAAQLSEQLTKAQLSALRQQIEPHFLFNTLNTIAGLVREGRNDDAVDMIAGLSELLRVTLKTSDRQEVKLGEELEMVKKYLEIEKARFAERLQVNVHVAAELRHARVPSLILQPIVENAVKHGIANRVQGGAIGIRAERLNGVLTLCVRNDGSGFPEDWEHQAGLGLKNVRERLASLYGKEAKLTVGSGETSGAFVAISLPYSDVQEVKEVKE